jgi:uncharacterized protein YbaR (Trm112 family)
MTDPRLLQLLACPRCHGPLQSHASGAWLTCGADRTAYPVDAGIARLVLDAEQPLAKLDSTAPR